MSTPPDPRRTVAAVRVATLWHPDGGYVDSAGPGEYTLNERVDGLLMLACPGCGRVSGMSVGNPKPDNRNGATWLLFGDPDRLTLNPSVNCVGCCGWHGWVTDGVFRPC